MAVNYILEFFPYPMRTDIEYSSIPNFVFTGEAARQLMTLVELRQDLKVNNFYVREVKEISIINKSKPIPLTGFGDIKALSEIVGETKSSDEIEFKMIAYFTKQPYETNPIQPAPTPTA